MTSRMRRPNQPSRPSANASSVADAASIRTPSLSPGSVENPSPNRISSNVAAARVSTASRASPRVIPPTSTSPMLTPRRISSCLSRYQTTATVSRRPATRASPAFLRLRP